MQRTMNMHVENWSWISVEHNTEMRRTVLTIFPTTTKCGDNPFCKRLTLLIFVHRTHFIYIYNKCFVGYNNPWDSNLERNCSVHCSLQLQYAGNIDQLYPYSTWGATLWKHSKCTMLISWSGDFDESFAICYNGGLWLCVTLLKIVTYFKGGIRIYYCNFIWCYMWLNNNMSSRLNKIVCEKYLTTRVIPELHLLILLIIRFSAVMWHYNGLHTWYFHIP